MEGGLNKPPFKVGDFMIIVLTENKSMPNVINKLFNESNTLVLDNVTLKDSTDVLHPAFTFKSDTVPTFNYCYIPDFNRYYFVTVTNTYPKGVYTVSCDVDVLKTYQNNILYATTNSLITKSDAYNPYVDDGYMSEVRKEFDVYVCDNGFTGDKTTVLVTVGGV